MDYDRWLLGGALDFGGLLVAYLFVGTPVGGAMDEALRLVGWRLPLTALEGPLVLGAVATAAAEVTGNRPGPVASVGFSAAFVVVRIPLLVPVALTVDSRVLLALVDVVGLVAAYVLAFRWGADGTARRFQHTLGRLTWTPESERRAER